MEIENETLQKIKKRIIYPRQYFLICIAIFLTMFFVDKMMDGATFSQVFQIVATPVIFLRFVIMAYFLGMFVPVKKNKTEK